MAGSAARNAPAGVASLEPQTSTQNLRFKGFPPLPNIAGVVADSKSAQNTAESSPVTAPTPQPAASVSPEKQEPGSDAAVTQDYTDDTPAAKQMSFEECWLKMVDTLFKKKPAFYHQLRDYIPENDSGVVTIGVENEFQKNHLESLKRTIIDFWNENFESKISEIKLVVQQHEKKKIIYTDEDKLENMIEQNAELKDFLQLLNFRIKN